MDEFNGQIQNFQQRYHHIKERIKNEEQTKNSLIVPFFSDILGWDMTNPFDVRLNALRICGVKKEIKSITHS